MFKLTKTHHELLTCLKEQGYYDEIVGKICFDLQTVCLVEDLVDEINSNKNKEDKPKKGWGTSYGY